MPRTWVWIQLIIGWLPIWALFTALMMVAHATSFAQSAQVSLRMIIAAAALGVLVHRFTARLPWPYPFRPSFVAVHLLAAMVYSLCWVALNSLIESLLRLQLVITLGPGLFAYLVTGIWMYVMIAGVTYAQRAAERGAQLAAQEARAQLAVLRAQLHPHFLFNALHTVVQLIPLDPRAAARAAEQLSEVLRHATEERRDLVPLRDEWAFVQRYLEIEKIRFGERLRVNAMIDDAALASLLPSFALQTLVENAVRHAAAPRVQATELTIVAQSKVGLLELTVSDDGEGVDLADIEKGAGTGLIRLRERLSWLYGSAAQLRLHSAPQQGFSVRLSVPQSSDEGPIDHD